MISRSHGYYFIALLLFRPPCLIKIEFDSTHIPPRLALCTSQNFRWLRSRTGLSHVGSGPYKNEVCPLIPSTSACSFVPCCSGADLAPGEIPCVLQIQPRRPPARQTSTHDPPERPRCQAVTLNLTAARQGLLCISQLFPHPHCYNLFHLLSIRPSCFEYLRELDGSEMKCSLDLISTISCMQ